MKPAFFITTMLIVSAALSAQRYSDQICGEVIQIDSATYYQTEQHGTYWDTVTAPIQKINHTILVVTKDSTYSFTDQWEDQIEDYLPNYYYLGRWKEWVLIMEEDLHRQFYYAINLKENRIDSLVGYPIVYGNRWLCQESSYSDSPGYIEVWQIEQNRAEMIQKFSFRYCNFSFLKQSYLFSDQFYASWEKPTTLRNEYQNFYLTLRLQY